MARAGKDTASDGSEKEKEGSDGIEFNQHLFTQGPSTQEKQTTFLTKADDAPLALPTAAIKCSA